MYLDEIAAQIGTHCGMKMEGEERRLLRIYAVLALTKGPHIALEDVHHAWAAWRAETNPEHRSLVPFGAHAWDGDVHGGSGLRHP